MPEYGIIDFLKIEIQLIYNVILVSGVQCSELYFYRLYFI